MIDFRRLRARKICKLNTIELIRNFFDLEKPEQLFNKFQNEGILTHRL